MAAYDVEQEQDFPYNGGDSPPARHKDYEVFSPRNSNDNGDRYERASRDSEREKERSRDKEKNRDKDRDRDRERRHRDERRETSRDIRSRSERERSRDRERSHDRYPHRSHERSRDRDRRSHDRDRERRHRHRSRSRSGGRSGSFSRRRSRTRSPSRETRRKRTSGFDMVPPGATVVAGAGAPGSVAGVAQTMPGVFPMAPFGNAQFGVSTMPVQAMTQQATRHARRVYVGGLPPLANEQTIATFFSQVMAAIGGNTAGPGDAVVNVYINHEKKFAFVEMRTVEEASNAMALDGLIFEGAPVRVRRPSDYNPSMAAALGPSQPSPHLNLAAVGLTPGATGGADGPDRVFVGGLPYYFTEAQIKELLESFGPLRGFDLVKDRDTGNSKGYGFCVYQDPAVTDIACAALNGLKMGDKTLTVRRATASGQPKPDQSNILAEAQQQIAFQKLALQATNGVSALMPGLLAGAAENPTKVVCLTQVVNVDELLDDQEYEDIYEDMKEECGKYGVITTLAMPRPKSTGEEVPGVGKVFVEYADTQGAAKAKASLNGRKFGGNVVVAVYYPEDKFSAGQYGD
eukprot:Gb_16437 [translate_table: standard]